MTDLDRGALADEILSALDTAGEFESWIDRRLPSLGNNELIAETFRVVTQRLLSVDPPKTDRWEHLLFVTAASSAKSCPITRERRVIDSSASKASSCRLRRLSFFSINGSSKPGS